MGLIGIALASLVNILWQNNGLQFVISLIGVIVFTGLALYLDFITLSLILLRFMGHRRD
jgi:FtsH-binding integral membrane protein